MSEAPARNHSTASGHSIPSRAPGRAGHEAPAAPATENREASPIALVLVLPLSGAAVVDCDGEKAELETHHEEKNIPIGLLKTAGDALPG